jgi:hypothetical protein
MQLLGIMAQLAASQSAAQGHRAAGQAQATAYREQAEQAESSAKDRELQRLVKLRRVMAGQRAHWAASGVDSSSGSPTTIAGRSYEMFELEEGADLINTRQQIRSFNNSANSAIRIGRIKARGSMLSGYTQTAKSISELPTGYFS